MSKIPHCWKSHVAAQYVCDGFEDIDQVSSVDGVDGVVNFQPKL